MQTEKAPIAMLCTNAQKIAKELAVQGFAKRCNWSREERKILSWHGPRKHCKPMLFKCRLPILFRATLVFVWYLELRFGRQLPYRLRHCLLKFIKDVSNRLQARRAVPLRWQFVLALEAGAPQYAGLVVQRVYAVLLLNQLHAQSRMQASYLIRAAHPIPHAYYRFTTRAGFLPSSHGTLLARRTQSDVLIVAHFL